MSERSGLICPAGYTAVHLDADFIDGKIDLHGLDALARRPAVLDIP